MAQLIATNQLTLTNLNDGKSVKDNLFSATNFALAKYAHPSQPTVLVSWKYNGKPNTKYTLSTDVPKNVQGTYDLFFDVYPSTPSSVSNGVAINVPRTITTDATGVIEITSRTGATANSIIAKTSHVKLEENDMATAFIFHPDDQIGDKGAQGIPGPKGADGKTQYTHIAYADNATGGGFSQTDQSKAYIGMYQDFIATDSTNPVSYKWTKWKGTDGAQGIPGPKGADGQTPYIHFAYSDNADGTGLTTSDNGQRYMGYYTDYMPADSTDKTKYRWSDRWAKIDVNGRNLAQKTSSDWSKPYTSFSGTANTCPPLYKVLVDDLKVGDTLKSRIVLKYTDIVPASGKTATILLQGTGNVTVWNAGRYTNSTYIPISGSWEMVFEHEFKITADHLKNAYWNWSFRTDYIASGSLQWRLAKVEKGTVFTGWSQSPEDIQADIDSKADQGLTQEQLNALNERNQILESEMQAKASMEAFSELEKAYHAFVAKNEKDSAQSEQDLIEAGRRIELLTTQFGGLKELKTFIDTYMSSSNEGLIIGKNDASSTIKVSSDRISMFSAGKEVMYISQGVINIDNGIFTKSLQIGRFRTEQYHLNADMNVIRYVGG